MDEAHAEYESRCFQLKEEITQCIKDGAMEGIQQGIENGFLEGIRESADMGFTSLLENLKTDGELVLSTMANELVEQEIEDRVNEKICPLLKPRMDQACTRVLKKIEASEGGSNLLEADQKLHLEELAQEQLDQCIQSLNQFMPDNFLFQRIFNGCERAISACLMNNVAECETMVKDKLDIQTEIREGEQNG